MGRQKQASTFQIIFKDCSCGCCPAIMEGANPDELVVVGKLDEEVLNNEAVRKQTGEGEIAVVIPRDLLLKAAKALKLEQT